MKEIKNFITFFRTKIGFNLFPVFIINLIILLFIIIKRDLYGIDLYFNLIINPVYLVIINMVHSIKYKKHIFIKNILLMVFSSTIGMIFIYIHLVIALRQLLIPTEYEDGILIYLSIVFIILVFIIGIIEQIILSYLYKLRWKTKL
jgi:hypothetical protein